MDPRWQQLRVAFGVELEERVRALNQLLLKLERSNGDTQYVAEIFESLFREAHSLKGAARAVEFNALEDLAHTVESALINVRTGNVAPTTPWFDALYRAADMFSPLYQAAMNDAPPSPELDGVLADLRTLQTAPLVSPKPQPPAVLQTKIDPQPQMLAAPESLPEPPIIPAKQPQPEPLIAPNVPRASSEADGTRTSVRVAVNKLDALLAQAGELAVTHIRIERRHGEFKALRREFSTWRRDWRTRRGLRSHLRQLISRLDGSHASLKRDIEELVSLAERGEQRTAALLQQIEEITMRLRDDLAGLGQVAQSIEGEVMAVRLMPVSTIFGPFERMVRDLARAQSKDIRLLLEGAETEIDRKILEQLRDPLMHMLRNAIDHGIETPAKRQTSGKPRMGTLRLSAMQRSGVVEIELEDDGAGIDPARVREVAVAKGLLSPDQAAQLDDQAALELIFRPGFSTTTVVTETSGRGVGMDIVRANVEQLDGRVRLTSVRGKGTLFTISLPLTLATTRALLVEQSGMTFAVPTSTIERSARVQEQQLWSIEGRRVIQIDGVSVPVIELADVLELPRSTSQDRQEGAWRPVFVLRQDGHKLAFLINQLVGEQELVIKSLSWPLQRVRNVGGVAVLGSGETTVILNPADLFKSGLKMLGAGPGLHATSIVETQQRRQRILVVDDSLTTRTLERSILESAGYDTLVASDGQEALTVLRSEQIDLVVSDIEMPRLDGFGLTAQIRNDERLRQIPVVLVTSLEAREHRERGVEVGADAYIVKGSFDQTILLQTVGRLL